ncbi:MAG: T9SS type A sorting domain-containing protein [Flavobacteriales bacterium]|nr:T9SS type A sorting domain-containing protein [Flavobacteriales bacterium]
MFFSTLKNALAFTLFMLLSSSIHQTFAQITVSLGSGTQVSQTSPSAPSPYNYDMPSRTMQFVYTASEIFSAGGKPGEITALAWKVDDVCSGDLVNYTIRMKGTSATNVAKYDYNNLKTVKYAHTLRSSSSGWLTIPFDSIFLWDGTSNILIDVCFGMNSGSSSTGSVYLYDNSNNMRIGDYTQKGTICGSTSGSASTYKPFIQFTINPICPVPKGIKAQSSSNSVQISWQPVLPTPDKGYEYVVSDNNSSPTSGTATKNTSIQVNGLCPSKLYYVFVRTRCDSTWNSDWSKPVTFKTTSNAEAKANSPLCEGEDLKLTINPGLSYQWNGPSGFSSNLREPSIKNVGRSHRGNYSVILTDSNKCQTLLWVPVRVDTVPVLKIHTPASVCDGSLLTLDADGVDSAIWSGPDSYTSFRKRSEFKASTKSEGVYKAIGFNSYGCSSVDSSFVDVLARPDLGISSNAPLCEASTLELSANSLSNPVWTFPNNNTSNSGNVSIKNMSNSMQGWYHFSANDQFCSNSDSVYVEMKPAPNIVYDGNSEVCFGEDLSLTATGAVTYTWSNKNGTLGTGQPYVLSNVEPGTVDGLKLTGVGANGCEKTIDVSIKINLLPNVIIKPIPNVCEGDDFVLDAAFTANGNYVWTGPNGFSSNTKKVTIRNADRNDIGTYTLSFTDAFGCTNARDIEVDVHELPEVTLQNEASKLWATEGYAKYTWYQDGSEISGANQSVYWAQALGTYRVVVTDEFGCENSSENVKVTVLGMPQFERSVLSVYPNPSTGIVHLTLDQPLGKVSISDASGKIIYSSYTHEKSTEIDLSNTEPGLYFISCEDKVKLRTALILN